MQLIIEFNMPLYCNTKMAKKKTSTITFRIDEENDNKLRQIAEDKKISLNTLANQIFGNYVQLERYMEKFGVLMMSQNAFLSILNMLDEKQIIKFGSDVGSKEPKEFILFKWKDINSDSVADFITLYFEHCGYGSCDLERTENEIGISGTKLFQTHCLVHYFFRLVALSAACVVARLKHAHLFSVSVLVHW